MAKPWNKAQQPHILFHYLSGWHRSRGLQLVKDLSATKEPDAYDQSTNPFNSCKPSPQDFRVGHQPPFSLKGLIKPLFWWGDWHTTVGLSGHEATWNGSSHINLSTTHPIDIWYLVYFFEANLPRTCTTGRNVKNHIKHHAAGFFLGTFHHVKGYENDP